MHLAHHLHTLRRETRASYENITIVGLVTPMPIYGGVNLSIIDMDYKAQFIDNKSWRDTHIIKFIHGALHQIDASRNAFIYLLNLERKTWLNRN